MADIDVKKKVEEALAANPELIEKVKSAPAEALQAIRNITGLDLNASDLDKVKAAFRDFTGDDGLDLGDFARAAENLFNKGKDVAKGVDVDALKDGAADVLGKGAEAAGGLLEKGKDLLGGVLGDKDKQ